MCMCLKMTSLTAASGLLHHGRVLIGVCVPVVVVGVFVVVVGV